MARLALVIGNGNYRKSGWLANPPADAVAMAETLRGIGFEVAHATDLGMAEFPNEITRFEERLIGGVDVALLFYAGHGLQM